MSRFDTLDGWLRWLETLHPRAIDLGLERVRTVADRLGVLAPGVPVVTVTGTNGKGSTVALLEALLAAHGLRVACYTSPHILRFNERVRIGGRDVEDASLVTALAAVDAARGDVSLTYFEFTTLAAFLLFRDAGVDVQVLEVGLGGRLDAVNIVDADVAVITSVGLDHREWLGDTRESVGREKAGILRAGRAAVIGDDDPPASVCDAVRLLPARGYFAGRDFHADAADGDRWHWSGTDATGARRDLQDLPQPALALANAATALQVLHLLPWSVRESAVRSALAGVHLSGRNQRFRVQGRDVVVDVGHNAHAFRFLRQELLRLGRGERFHVVLGMLADKDIAAAVRELEALALSWHIAPLPSPRSASVVQLQAAIAGASHAHASVDEALRAALAAGDASPVLVTGSFHTVGEAMPFLQAHCAENP